MRIQVPTLPQDRPTNPRNSLAGRWYATIHNNNTDQDENDDDTDSQLESSSNIENEDMRLPQRHGYRKHQPERNTPNTLGDFVLHNHQVMNQFGLRYDDLPQGYQQHQQQQPQQMKEPQHYSATRVDLTSMPSISSTEDIARAGMQRYQSHESGASSTPVPSGLLSTQHPRIDDRRSMSETKRENPENKNREGRGKLETTRRPRSRSPAPDVSFLRRYRQQNRERIHKKEQPTKDSAEMSGEGNDGINNHLELQHGSMHQKQAEKAENEKAIPSDHPVQSQTLSYLDRGISSSSGGPLRKTIMLSSGSYAIHQRQMQQYHRPTSSLSNQSSEQPNVPQHDKFCVESDPQRYNFENGRWFPNSHSQDTAKAGNFSRSSQDLGTIPTNNWNSIHAIRPGRDDPIDVDRRRRTEEELLWNVGNQMQIVREARQEQRCDNKTPPSHHQNNTYERRQAPPPPNQIPKATQPAPNFEEPDPVFETRIDYFDDGIIMQPSAFDAVRPDGYRVFPNTALADANESIASTLPPVDLNYKHPYAYRPPPERSIKNFQCHPNSTPVSPMNLPSPSAGMKAIVEKSKSIFKLLGPSLIPRGCVPIGQLSEAIAAEDDDKVKRASRGIWDFLDPNNDLSGYDDGSSFGSSERRSPRKRSALQRISSYDDENSFTHQDRYNRKESYPTQVRSNARPTPDAFREEDFEEEGRDSNQRTYRTKITVHQKNVTSGETSGKEQTMYAGEVPSNDSDPFEDVVQEQRGGEFVDDFEPFEENIHQAIWGSEESPDPIFSSTDPKTMRRKTSRRERHSTGGMENSARRGGMTQQANQQRPKSTGRSGRNLGLSTKQNIQSERGILNRTMSRSQSAGRGSRIEGFLQRLTGQSENLPSGGASGLKKRHQRSRSGSKHGNTPKSTKSADLTDATRRRSRSGSNRDSQRSRNTLLSETSAWEGVDIFATDLEKLKRNRPRSSIEDNRATNNLNRVRDKKIQNAERVRTFDSEALRNQSGKSKRSFSPRTPRKSQSPGRVRMSQRLEERFDDAASNHVGIRRANEDRDGHYMYVAYSRFDDDAQRVLQLCEHQTVPEPRSRSGEVLVRVETSTVSSSDCAIRRGEWANMSLNPYIIPGVAIVGQVHNEGRKDRKSNSTFSFSAPIKPGDMVMALMSSGANARYACLHKSQLVKVPPKVRLDHAVCLVETYLTAFQVLHMGHRGASRYQDCSLEGQSILVLGGYSALGRALIELSVAGGAEYCYASACQLPSRSRRGASSSIPSARRQFETLTQWGAIPLSSDPQDWLTLVGRQIDLMVTIYDPSEQALYNEIVSDDHCKALRKDGQIVVICTHPGINKDEEGEDVFIDRPSRMDRRSHSPFRLPAFRGNPRDELFEERTVWYNVFDSWERSKPDRYGNGGKAVAKRDLEHLLEMLERNKLHPEVLECIPLSKIGKAQFILENKRLSGHLVCAPWLKQQTAVLTPSMAGKGKGKERKFK